MKSGSCAYVNEARVSRSHKGWEPAQLAAVMNGRGTTPVMYWHRRRCRRRSPSPSLTHVETVPMLRSAGSPFIFTASSLFFAWYFFAVSGHLGTCVALDSGGIIQPPVL